MNEPLNESEGSDINGNNQLELDEAEIFQLPKTQESNAVSDNDSHASIDDEILPPDAAQDVEDSSSTREDFSEESFSSFRKSLPSPEPESATEDEEDLIVESPKLSPCRKRKAIVFESDDE
jgi:hypothetical protein